MVSEGDVWQTVQLTMQPWVADIVLDGVRVLGLENKLLFGLGVGEVAAVSH